MLFAGISTQPFAYEDRPAAVVSYNPTSGYPAEDAVEKAADGNLHADMATNVADTSETMRTILLTDSTGTHGVAAASDGNLPGSTLLNSTMIDSGHGKLY